MNRVQYKIPLTVQISHELHQHVQNFLLDNKIQRYSTCLSRQQRAKKSESLMYANDLVNILDNLSSQRKKHKNRLDNLMRILIKFKLISSMSMKQDQMYQQINSNLGKLFTICEKNKKMNDIMEEIMKQGLSSIQNFQMLNIFKENQGQTFYKFMKYLEMQTIQISRQNRLALFIKSLQNAEDTKAFNDSFRMLNQLQRQFIIPAYNLYLQHQNKLIKIQQQDQMSIIPLVKMSSSWFKSFIKTNSSKKEEQERLIEKKKQQSINELLEDYRRQKEDNQKLKKEFKKIKDELDLKISKLQNNLKILQQKDSNYAKFEQQNKKISFEIKRQKLQIEDSVEKMQNLQIKNKSLTLQNEKLKSENNNLRINQSLCNKNYQQLQKLLRQYEENEKQLELSLQKQQQKSFQLVNLCEQYKRQLIACNRNKSTNSIQRDDNIASDCAFQRENELQQQNKRLRQEINILNIKLTRLTQSNKALTAVKEQRIANLQLQLFDLTTKLARVGSK